MKNEINIRQTDRKMIELVKLLTTEELYLAMGVVLGKRMSKITKEQKSNC